MTEKTAFYIRNANCQANGFLMENISAKHKNIYQIFFALGGSKWIWNLDQTEDDWK